MLRAIGAAYGSGASLNYSRDVAIRAHGWLPSPREFLMALDDYLTDRDLDYDIYEATM